MPQNLPCPNPTCSHTFSPDQIKGASSLKCPACGTVFHLRTGGSGKGPPGDKPAMGKPVPGPVKKIPIAQLVQPGKTKPGKPAGLPMPADIFVDDNQPPLQDTIVSGPEENPIKKAPQPESNPFPSGVVSDAVESSWPLIRRRSQKRSWRLGPIFVILLSTGAIGGGIYAAIKLDIFKKGTGGPEGGTGNIFIAKIRNFQNQDEKIFKVTLPGKSWTANNKLKADLKAIYAVERSRPDAWIAFAAKDYGQQKPRNAELMKDGLEKLQNYFGETLELAAKAHGGEIASQPGQTLEFRGQIGPVVWRGEFHMFTLNGIGYFLYVGATSLEEAQLVFEEFQKEELGFETITERRGWSPQPPRVDTFQALKLPLSIQAPVSIWEKFNPLDEDENGELFLRGVYQKEKDNRKNAFLLVLSLTKQGDIKDAVKFATDYVQTAEQKHIKEYQLVPIDSEKSDANVEIGNRRGRLLELKLQLGPEPKRFILLAVLNEEENLIAIRCECPWESRQIWRQDFIDLLANVRVRK